MHNNKFFFFTTQITFELTVKQLMSFDPCEWTESLRKEYVLVIEGFFTVALPIFTTYRRAIKVQLIMFLLNMLLLFLANKLT
jgi:hypothetical protein